MSEQSAVLDEELDRLVGIVGDLEAEQWALVVPTCPGWDVADLIGHLGEVHRWVTVAVREGHGRSQHPAPAADRMAEWFAHGALQLRQVLAVDPTTPAWTFDPERRDVGFWRRRQVHENVIHRVDLESALGVPISPIDPITAADGIAEVAEIFLPRRLRKGWLSPLPGTLALQPVDVDVPATRFGAGEADATLEATALELYLAVWKRGAAPSQWRGDVELGRRILGMPLSS